MPCIAVIEDEPHLLDLMEDVLEVGGYTMLSITDLDSAADVVEQSHPALFLVDIMLQGRSGIDIARELREDGYTNTPIIAMSASPSMASFARQSGLFQDIVDKPFDIDVLLNTIDRYAGTLRSD